METLKELSQAMFCNSMPCNPQPFINGLNEGCKTNGSNYIETDEAKRLLFVLLCQSYGQLFNIDSLTEFGRLLKTR